LKQEQYLKEIANSTTRYALRQKLIFLLQCSFEKFKKLYLKLKNRYN